MDNSGMVESYSKMCLEQNDWNFNRAAEKFLELKNAGQLPADAWQSGRAP
jgi:nuclear RNA export factor